MEIGRHSRKAVDDVDGFLTCNRCRNVAGRLQVRRAIPEVRRSRSSASSDRKQPRVFAVYVFRRSSTSACVSSFSRTRRCAYCWNTVGCDLILLIHQRLGVRWVVTFVVAVAPIANDIDDNVSIELLTEIERQLRDTKHRFRIVAVDVPHRRNNRFCDVRCVGVRNVSHRGRL